MRKLILAFVLLGCENAPDPADQDIVVKDETVARLSRQLRQQDNFDDAYRAFRLLMQAGQKGIDVIMALDSAGAMNENVWRGVRQGLWLTDEVCPQLPEFTACVQNACRRKLGISDVIGTLQFSCPDLPLIRGAFRPEEFEGLAAGCGADTLAVYRSRFFGQVDDLNIRLPLSSQGPCREQRPPGRRRQAPRPLGRQPQGRRRRTPALLPPGRIPLCPYP